MEAKNLESSAMSETVAKDTFRSMYAGQAPWDIDHAQKPLVDVADRITGSVLDAGCGTGENALDFAGLGRRVTGIDFIEEAINRAKRKAAERGRLAAAPTPGENNCRARKRAGGSRDTMLIE